jgi:microcystin-dependent protein
MAAVLSYLVAFAGDEAPDGFLLCDGSEVPRSRYPVLFSLIGNSYGEPSRRSLFLLPDLRGRTILGASSALPLADVGGAATVTLEEDNLPSHSHGVTDPGHVHSASAAPHSHNITDPGHVHAGAGVSASTAGAGAGGNDDADSASATTGITVNNATVNVTIANGTTGIAVEPAGGGDAFSVRNPYVALNYIIKT